ncbi:hypothetical protein D8M20_09905 [Corynebacterium propinquum]|nr:hypothetical protein D8M24_09915 [Corynebacterium propinquum]RUP87826.1 hypothetical protein D8M40_09915 [Corynebacterium propinquum]RUP92788.1 hypothetical protein D8M20_09905 [Corynebacterium propinquum]
MFKTPMGQARKWARKESQRRGNGHTRKNAPPSHDDVIAQFTLGNWSNLLGEALPDHRSNAKRLWKECLHHAFPNAGIEDQWRENIGKKVERLTRLRNRVSHQENLLETNVRGRLNDLITVLRAIDTSYPSWTMEDSQVRRVAQEDPRKSWT